MHRRFRDLRAALPYIGVMDPLPQTLFDIYALGCPADWGSATAY